MDLYLIDADRCGVCPWSHGDRTKRKGRSTVETVDEIHAVHDTLLTERLSASRELFFGRLEDKPDSTADKLRLGCQDLCEGQKNRRVDIMTTGVHDARNLGLIWKIIFLFDRERIDVCAEGDAWSRFLSLYDGNGAGPGNSLHQRNAEGCQGAADIFRCVCLLEG